MCRWLAYSGAPVLIEEVVFKTEHSLIDQSLHARSSKTTTNADGFGIGWYGERETPGLYRETHPAWNDVNLRDLAAQVRSPMFLAHVRAATDTAVQQTNCHPFRHGKWLFQHNGVIREFPAIRRQLLMAVDPKFFGSIVGTTDSELMFHLALTLGLEDEPKAALERMVALVESIGQEHGVEHPMQMTVGMSDGRRLYAARYSSEHDSRTLFHSRDVAALVALNPDLADRLPPETRLVVSEPVTDVVDYWQEVPEASFLTVEGESIELEPLRPGA